MAGLLQAFLEVVGGLAIILHDEDLHGISLDGGNDRNGIIHATGPSGKGTAAADGGPLPQEAPSRMTSASACSPLQRPGRGIRAAERDQPCWMGRATKREPLSRVTWTSTALRPALAASFIALVTSLAVFTGLALTEVMTSPA